MNQVELGWNSHFEEQWRKYRSNQLLSDKLFPGRVISEQKNLYRVLSAKGEYLAYISGKMNFESISSDNYPAVGDFVVLELPNLSERCIIHGVLPRKSVFKRKEAGKKSNEQVVASNIDYVFLVSALDSDFNLRRIERYLALAWESGAKPVILLNKADLVEDWEEKFKKVERIAFGTPVHLISCFDQRGFETLSAYIRPGITIALLGSSGVGKSSIINLLLGESVQDTQGLRKRDNGGKHTTTSREIFKLPGGGLIVDTPGMRELQLTNLENGFTESFVDIDILSKECRFADCRHQSEPGCAVLKAINDGTLDLGRLKNYHKLQKEIEYYDQRENKENNNKKKRLITISKLRKKLKK